MTIKLHLWWMNEWIHEWWCTRIGIRMSLDRFSRTYNDPPCTFRAASSKAEKITHEKDLKKEHSHLHLCVLVCSMLWIYSFRRASHLIIFSALFFPLSFLFRYILLVFFLFFSYIRVDFCWGFVNISFPLNYIYFCRFFECQYVLRLRATVQQCL